MIIVQPKPVEWKRIRQHGGRIVFLSTLDWDVSARGLLIWSSFLLK
jgi:hypothetical protein